MRRSSGRTSPEGPQPGDETWVLAAAGDALVRVHVGPGSARPGVDGVHGAAVRIRVRARPVDGAANRELLEILAAALGVRPALLSIEAGARGRDKCIRVHGMTAEGVRARLRPILSVDTTARRH